MKGLKEKVSITLDGDVVKTIRELAEKNERSLSQCINIILKKFIEKNIKEENK